MVPACLKGTQPPSHSHRGRHRSPRAPQRRRVVRNAHYHGLRSIIARRHGLISIRPRPRRDGRTRLDGWVDGTGDGKVAHAFRIARWELAAPVSVATRVHRLERLVVLLHLQRVRRREIHHLHYQRQVRRGPRLPIHSSNPTLSLAALEPVPAALGSYKASSSACNPRCVGFRNPREDCSQL